MSAATPRPEGLTVPVEPPAPPRRTPLSGPVSATGVLAPGLGAVVLLAGLIARLPALAVVAAAVAISAGVPAVRLVLLALGIHARHHGSGPCRGAGLLGMGALATGSAVSSLPFFSPTGRPYVALSGLVAAAGANVLALLLLPGTAPTLAARLRRTLDGVGIAVSLLFAGRVVLPVPPDEVPRVALVAILVACCALAIVALAVLGAVRYRRAAALCGAGGGLAVIGLVGIAIAVTMDAADTPLFAAAPALIIAPTLAWAGARRADSAPSPMGPADQAGTFSSYPVLSIPVAMAAVAAGYRVITVGSLDATSLGLGAAVGASIAAREALAAIDVRRYAQRLAGREAHFRSLVAGSTDVTVVVDPDLVVRWQSPAAARQFGLSDLDVLGHTLVDLMHPDDAGPVTDRLREVLAGDPAEPSRPALVEARLRDGVGQWRDTESTVSDLRGTPEVGALVVHVRDVGERKRLERTLHRLAFTDQLTGLPNRRELLRSVATLRGVPGRTGAVLVLDVDGVTRVNEVRGREVGDAVLIEVANRLRAGIGPDDVAARLGGDEFGVVTPDRPIEAYGLGMRLLTTLAAPYELPGVTVHLCTGVGVAEVTRDSVDEILYRADVACRRAQQLGSGRVEWYDESLEALLLRRSTLERSLPGAAERGELDLLYQPIVDLLDRRPVGVEALLRWRHPRLGTVLPAESVPIAEQLGVIGEVGTWVLDNACRQLAGWRRDGLDVWVSVNVSPRQLAAHGFLPGVTASVDRHGVPADRLTFEIAESGVGTDLSTVVTQLAGLRALGIRTAVDHFGAGQTSLAYLRRLPVDILKIDSGLFLEPARRGGATAPTPPAPLVDVVVDLGRRLGMEVVAEGLELEAHVALVRGAGCRYGQGFMFGRPAPAEHVEAYLDSYRAQPGMG